jgi:hypothetical protein
MRANTQPSAALVWWRCSAPLGWAKSLAASHGHNDVGMF